jgi:hypothetical protein
MKIEQTALEQSGHASTYDFMYSSPVRFLNFIKSCSKFHINSIVINNLHQVHIGRIIASS